VLKLRELLAKFESWKEGRFKFGEIFLGGFGLGGPRGKIGSQGGETKNSSPDLSINDSRKSGQHDKAHWGIGFLESNCGKGKERWGR